MTEKATTALPPIDDAAKPNMMKPGASLLLKLGSIVVHTEEFLSPHGHEFDEQAIRQLLADPEVVEWRAAMDAAAMLPKKRNA